MTNKFIMAWVFGLVCLTTEAKSASKGGVQFPDTLEVSGQELVLNGLGVREATIFGVDVYVAGLYLEKKITQAADIVKPDRMKHLWLKFVRDVDYDDLAEAYREGFEKNGAGPALAAPIKQFVGWFADMKEGQSFSVTFRPGEGTTLTVEGQKKGTVQGDDFARVFFLIFLGPKPPNRGLRAGLLGEE